MRSGRGPGELRGGEEFFGLTDSGLAEFAVDAAGAVHELAEVVEGRFRGREGFLRTAVFFI